MVLIENLPETGNIIAGNNNSATGELGRFTAVGNTICEFDISQINKEGYIILSTSNSGSSQEVINMYLIP